jgi:hypothetical protein
MEKEEGPIHVVERLNSSHRAQNETIFLPNKKFLTQLELSTGRGDPSFSSKKKKQGCCLD